MKKRFLAIIAGVLAGVLLASGTVFAKQLSETVDVFYNNIKIYIDGAEIVPQDSTGNIVEPFIYNGTTYLPVRAVANAFGKDVEWDGETQGVYIGKKDETKPDNYLHKIQYNDYKEANINDDFAIINGTITDYNKNIYTNGLLFYIKWHSELADDEDKSDILVAYPLNSQYKSLKGNIVVPRSYNITTWGERNCDSASNDVFFYGDGELLYKATNVNASMPFNIDIDVKGVNQLTIKIKCENNSSTHIAITDLALYN